MQPNRKIGETLDEMGSHSVRMDAGKQAKRAEVEKHQRCRKKPQLRWEDSVRRDKNMKRLGEDEIWRGGCR